jgi:hypothetical protein
MGVPVSDTEVDGTPDGVEERDESVTYSHDERISAGWVRTALILLSLVVGLFVVAAMGSRMLLADIPDPGTDPAAETVAVRCWDGAVRPDEGCPTPSGRAGLRWVFPSFRPNELGCRNAIREFPTSNTRSSFVCEAKVEGAPVTILYSELADADLRRTYLEKKFGHAGEGAEDEGRLLWTEGDEPRGNGRYELVVVYADLPFSVEVSADSAAARDEALESLIEFRAADDVIDHT